jgi:ABC-type transporter Mla subunit MlaD
MLRPYGDINVTTTETNPIQTVDAQNLKMAEILTAVGPMVKDTKRMVRQIVKYGQQINQPELAAIAQQVGENVTFLREAVAQVGAVAAATHGALQATLEARDTILSELNGITTALNQFNTQHPALQAFAARVEDDVNDSAEWDWEDEQFRASQNLQLHFGTETILAVAQAEQLKELFFGEYAWTEEQAALIEQLVGTLDLPDWIEMQGGGVDD